MTGNLSNHRESCVLSPTAAWPPRGTNKEVMHGSRASRFQSSSGARGVKTAALFLLESQRVIISESGASNRKLDRGW